MSQLKINFAKIEQKLIKFIRAQMKQTGFKKVIVGLSGGLDSSVVAFLCSKALGQKNVFGFIMPYKSSSSQSINYAKCIADICGIRTKLINISPQIDVYFKKFPTANRIRRGNKMARERMSVLYDQSKALGALVVGTSNKTELLLGYGTIYGDVACAFNPLGGLYKTQIRQLAHDIGIPKKVIKQTPSAGLWPGQSDEAELGLTYAKADNLLYYLVDKKSSDKKLVKLGFKKALISRIKKRITDNAFKGSLPVIAKI